MSYRQAHGRRFKRVCESDCLLMSFNGLHRCGLNMLALLIMDLVESIQMKYARLELAYNTEFLTIGPLSMKAAWRVCSKSLLTSMAEHRA